MSRRILLDHFRDVSTPDGLRGRQFIGVFSQEAGKYTWQIAWQQVIQGCSPGVKAITVDFTEDSMDMSKALPENAVKPKAMRPAEWDKILAKERRKLRHDLWTDITNSLAQKMELQQL